jgi:threonyl-tRNA synthetase
VGKGLPLWLPKGAIIREELISYLKKIQLKMGYQGVVSPHIANVKLYKISGHYDKYKDHAFGEICCPGEESYMLKPMNCPHHCQIYKSEPRSYRDLPLRFAEFGQVYRYEDSGAVNGLLRVRGFCQDDAHLFCRPDQVKVEINNIIKLVLYVLNEFDFKDFKAQISLRDSSDDKYIGSDEVWEQAESALIEAAKDNGLNYNIEKGEAAFYGPKIDFMVKDCLNREWQLGSIQLDYNLPDKFELEYIDSEGKPSRPVMIHRAPFGSLERFIAILLEHYQGRLPFWLSPEQVMILPISEKFNDFSDSIKSRLFDSDIRAVVDSRNERLPKKIKDAQLNYIPYMIVIGQKEVDSGILSIRSREGKEEKIDIDSFIKSVK